MRTIKLKEIAPRNGSPNDAFEELCCQLARRVAAKESVFERFRGSGGDGGVECLERTNDGRVIGWQAKYVFPIANLIKQADKSLMTALSVHSDLTEFVLCFPFDPTTSTGRKTKGKRKASCENDKLKAWVRKKCREAEAAGRKLVITLKPEDALKALLHEHDTEGGLREYFFNAAILSPDWFRQHLNRAASSSEPRYSPELKLDTPLYQWFETFGNAQAWKQLLVQRRACVERALEEFGTSVERLRVDWPGLPDSFRAAEVCRTWFQSATHSLQIRSKEALADFSAATDAALAEHRRYSHEIRTCPGGSDRIERWFSPLVPVLSDFAEWLGSPECVLGIQSVFILTGEGGSGKTHGICDMALKRLECGAMSCVLFGHQFEGQPTDWVRMAESLGMPSTLGQDALLDALNAAAEATGNTLVIWVDAINETTPRDYWRKRLKAFAAAITSRPFLRLCVSCRTSFVPICLPSEHDWPVFEHQGFAGMEARACKAFFEFYGLTPPLAPILQPELGNPLYLRLVCQTLKARKMSHLPPGWLGVIPVINAFLDEKENAFAEDHSSTVMKGEGMVRRSLHAISSRMAREQRSLLRMSDAQSAVNLACPHASHLGILKWLIHADLLIEDGNSDSTAGTFETAVRLAFERLSDFLIASGMMPGPDCYEPRVAITTSPQLSQLFSNGQSVARNAGWVAALSLLFAERWGVELPDQIADPEVRQAVLPIAVRALSWRSPESFNKGTEAMARGALFEGSDALRDSLLRISSQPSRIDALWIHKELAAKPLCDRDPSWCAYLLQSYERSGTVLTLIEAANESTVEDINADVALRWSLMLAWFGSAADRRVKDTATRALAKVFRHHPRLITDAVNTTKDVDDDDVLERLILAAYGALLVNRNSEAASELAKLLLEDYRDRPQRFQNAQIRDLIRCIGELAKHLGAKLNDPSPLTPTKRRKINWVPELATEEEIEQWTDWKVERGALYKAVHSCVDDDFNHYSIGCLGCWMENLNKIEIGQWLSKHLVDEFHVDSHAFDAYDERMSAYGYGRSKPAWAERIGKKYQWIALNRLASRLHDRYRREERRSWYPKPIRTPLILQEERKLDPSIPTAVLPDTAASDCWWQPARSNLSETKHLSFGEWAKRRDDLPEMCEMLRCIEHDGQRWRVLHSLREWSEYSERETDNSPYRSVWYHLRSYLVLNDEFADVIAAIGTRNYFQDWLPKGGDWLHCFLGEYPWATSFNTEPDSYMGAGTKLRNTELTLIHTANTINCEWQYDGSMERSIQYLVPAKAFFGRQQLKWNGGDGFHNKAGKTIFRDPHGTEGGKPALLADADELGRLLKKLGYRLVWTLLGGKDILSEPHDKHTPTEVFSQFAFLNESGELEVGPRRFYLEHMEDINPAPGYISRKPRPRLEVTVNSITFNG